MQIFSQSPVLKDWFYQKLLVSYAVLRGKCQRSEQKLSKRHFFIQGCVIWASAQVWNWCFLPWCSQELEKTHPACSDERINSQSFVHSICVGGRGQWVWKSKLTEEIGMKLRGNLCEQQPRCCESSPALAPALIPLCKGIFLSSPHGNPFPAFLWLLQALVGSALKWSVRSLWLNPRRNFMYQVLCIH